MVCMCVMIACIPPTRKMHLYGGGLGRYEHTDNLGACLVAIQMYICNIYLSNGVLTDQWGKIREHIETAYSRIPSQTALMMRNI